MRFASDTGGTFTDLIVEEDDGRLSMYKSATIPSDPVRGVLDAMELAADERDVSLAELLSRGDMFIHGTTHAINAIITGNTAKTALLTTKGHPDILVLREGGRSEPFNQTIPYPEPYIPRALTREVPERIGSNGAIVTALDEQAVTDILKDLGANNVEAIAVCLLWSIVNPDHELRIGEIIEQELPGTPYTLSHQLNPTLREYRRAIAAGMDASLKPLMGAYMSGLTGRLSEAGFEGRVQVLTSQGGMMDGEDLAESPIHAINSGPSMAPIAGHHYSRIDGIDNDIIVADTGGTTYDVSLVRGDTIPWTRETWIGHPYRGHMTGFPSVDVKSVGAGGGSIGWVDEGGMLHVGPESAGASPGPVCYGKGGERVTVTDAAVVLGYIDPDYFLGGAVQLRADLAMQSVSEQIARPLGLSDAEAAAAMIDVATENMVQAITDITVNQGIDPANAVLLGGGGAAGLNSTFIARRLGCRKLIIPEVGAALSAAGALMSDLSSEYRTMYYTVSDQFDYDKVNSVLKSLGNQCEAFIENTAVNAIETRIEYTLEARYRHQVWEIEVPLRSGQINGPEELDNLVRDFHAAHEAIFAFRDEVSAVEMVGWTAKVRCRLRDADVGRLQESDHKGISGTRRVYFSDGGEIDVALLRFEQLESGSISRGPAIIESPFTTIVVDYNASYSKTQAGSLIIELDSGASA
jgi:N-methylhydantoinase A